MLFNIVVFHMSAKYRKFGDTFCLIWLNQFLTGVVGNINNKSIFSYSHTVNVIQVG